jgi:carboxylesterase
MVQRSDLDPSPFFLPGGPVGMLLIHGFTGAPPEMRLLGDYLHGQGLTISGPLLPGHGTQPEDMNRFSWQDWVAHVDEALDELRARCQAVYVGGLSLGSLLSMVLAARRPDLQGAVFYSPPILLRTRLLGLARIARHFVPTLAKKDVSDMVDPTGDERLWCYEVHPVAAADQLQKLRGYARRLLPQISCPCLVVYSTGDSQLHPQSAGVTFAELGAADKELVTLHRSGHCVTVDGEWPLVAETTLRFITQRLPAALQAELARGGG